MLFMNMTKKLKAANSMGLQIENFPTLHPFFTPNFNPGYGFYLLSVLKELETTKKITDIEK